MCWEFPRSSQNKKSRQMGFKNSHDKHLQQSSTEDLTRTSQVVLATDPSSQLWELPPAVERRSVTPGIPGNCLLTGLFCGSGANWAHVPAKAFNLNKYKKQMLKKIAQTMDVKSRLDE